MYPEGYRESRKIDSISKENSFIQSPSPDWIKNRTLCALCVSAVRTDTSDDYPRYIPPTTDKHGVPMRRNRSTTTTFQRFECVEPDHSEIVGEFMDIRINLNSKGKNAVLYYRNWVA